MWNKLDHRVIFEDSVAMWNAVATSNDKLAAIGDETYVRNKIFSTKHCDITTVPERFYESGLGFALPNNSPYTEMFSNL